MIEIHQDQILRYGVHPGIRDLDLLKSALATPQAGMGEQYFHEDIIQMAAAYLYHIVCNYPFIDGNRRIGAVAALVFLALNGTEIEVDEQEFEELIRGIAEGRLAKDKAAGFLRLNRK